MKILRWICLSIACCITATAQGPLIPPAFYAVQGAPFTLTVKTRFEPIHVADPSWNTQRILRDSAGRQRYEPPVLDNIPQSSIVMIYDVVAAKIIRLDTDAKTAVVTPMKLGESAVLDVSQATSLPPANPSAGQTLLGTKEIIGLEAWGQKTTRTISSSSGTSQQERELWLSTHYRMPLLQVIRREGGTTTQSVWAFEAAEPDAKLFRIPRGFAVTETRTEPEPPPGVYRIGGGVSSPKILKSVNPSYSQEASANKISGTVVVSLIVDEEGKAHDVTVIRGVGYGLNEKAVEAVRQYRFKPATRDGVPVKVQIMMDVNFQVF